MAGSGNRAARYSQQARQTVDELFARTIRPWRPKGAPISLDGMYRPGRSMLDGLTLDQLRTFVTAVDAGSFPRLDASSDELSLS